VLYGETDAYSIGGELCEKCRDMQGEMKNMNKRSVFTGLRVRAVLMAMVLMVVTLFTAGCSANEITGTTNGNVVTNGQQQSVSGNDDGLDETADAEQDKSGITDEAESEQDKSTPETENEGLNSDSSEQADVSVNAEDEKENLTVLGKDSELKVHFVDVGQADCILIESAGEFMLVDAGNNADADLVVSYLKKAGVSKLSYVIGTHPHEDHIGGLDAVIDAFSIGKVILPAKEHTSKTFEDVLTAIENKNLKITKPVVGTEYALGDASFVIIAPNGKYGDELNDWSVGIKLTYGENSFVMCGDAESDAEKDILANGIDLSADVFKLGHHGSKTSNSQEFLDAVDPDYVVICTETNNSYGHPHKQVMDRLKKMDLDVYRTDEQGTIIVTSDGKNITFNQKPSTTYAIGSTENKVSDSEKNESKETSSSGAGTTTESTTNQTENTDKSNNETTDNKETIVYRTKNGSKYHVAGCRYLSKSKIEITLSEAKKTLEPCSVCHPPR